MPEPAADPPASRNPRCRKQRWRKQWSHRRPRLRRPSPARHAVYTPAGDPRRDTFKGPPRAPVRRRLSRGALLLILGVVAVLLSWVGISVFRTEPTSAPAATEAKSVESVVRKQPDASPSPISKVIPDVPRSARKTIRGTVRVSVRVIVDKAGTVRVATADDPGPSRYFERLAIEKKPAEPPTDSEEQRIMLVRFSFTRAGTTTTASSLQ